MDIQTKDGILLRNIPEGTPDEEIKARINKIRAESAEPKPKRSSAEEQMSKAVVLSPQDKAADIAQDTQPGNIAELEKEISRHPPGPEKDALVAEHNRIKASLFQNTKKAGVQQSSPTMTHPQPKRDYSVPELIAGSPLTRMVMGNPAIGLMRGAAHFGGLDSVNKHMEGYDKLEEAGREARGSSGFDAFKAIGGLLAPWGKLVPKGGSGLAKTGGMATEGAIAGFAAPGNKTDEDYLRGTLVGSAAGSLPVVGAMLKGTARSFDRLVPGGAGREATRRQIRDVGEGNRGIIADAIDKGQTLAGPPTTAQLVGHLPEGAPIAARENKLARTVGGPSAELAHRTEEQITARGDLIKGLLKSKVPERRDVGEALLAANQAGADKFLAALEGVDRSTLPKTINSKLDTAKADAQRALTAKRPKYPVTLPVDGPQGAFPLPAMTPAPISTINDLVGAAMSKYADPKIAAVQVERTLNPSKYADSIRPTQQNSIKDIVDQLLRRSTGPAVMAGTQENR